MKEKTIYQLGEYRITEYENGMLWWETHHGLGEQRSGKCFIHDDILIIGLPRHEDIGFLKLEFISKLYKLLPWNKTRHYCFASELLDVESGRRVKEDLLDHKLSLAGMDKTVAKPVTPEGAGTFRLDKYQISVAADGQISWQADGGMNRLVGGQCIIKSGVLFIGSQEYAEGERSKREFINKLKQLPKWDRTKIWSHSLALRVCEPQPEGYCPDTNHVQQDASGDRAYPKKRTTVYNRGSARPLRNLLPSGFRLRTPSLHLAHEWSWACGLRKRSSRRLLHGTKAWLVTLISLVIAGLLLGLTLSLKGLEKSLHWFRSSGDRQAG